MKATHYLTTALLGAICWGNPLVQPCMAQEATAALSPATQTAAMEAAALIPAEADNILVLDVQAWMKLHNAGAEAADMAPWDGIKSLAIGVPNGNVEALNNLIDFSGHLADGLSASLAFMGWQLLASEQVCALQLEQLEKLDIEGKTEDYQKIIDNVLSQLKFYVAIKTLPGREDVLAELRKLMAEPSDNGTEEAYEKNGWKGIYKRDNAAQGQPHATLYWLYKVKGDSILLACGSNPDEITAADSPEESALKHVPADFATPMVYPECTPLLLGRVDAPIMNCMQHLLKRTCRALAAPLHLTFTAVAASDFHAAEQIKKGVSALETLSTELSKLTPAIQKPLNLAVWHKTGTPDCIQIEAEWDACGAEFEKGTLHHARTIGTPIFTISSSPLRMPDAPNMRTVLEAGGEIVNSILYTISVPDENGKTPDAVFGAEYKRLLTAFFQFTDTLSGTWHFCAEEVSDTPITETAEGPTGTSSTRTTFNIKLNNRAEFLPAGKNVLTTMEGMVDNNEFGASLEVDFNKVTERTEGNITYFTTDGETGITALTEDELIISSCAPYGEALAKQRTPLTIRGLSGRILLEPTLQQAPGGEAGEPVLQFVNGCDFHLTTEGGCFKLSIDLFLPNKATSNNQTK